MSGGDSEYEAMNINAAEIALCVLVSSHTKSLLETSSVMNRWQHLAGCPFQRAGTGFENN